jgi:hypothetical protein
VEFVSNVGISQNRFYSKINACRINPDEGIDLARANERDFHDIRILRSTKSREIWLATKRLQDQRHGRNEGI